MNKTPSSPDALLAAESAFEAAAELVTAEANDRGNGLRVVIAHDPAEPAPEPCRFRTRRLVQADGLVRRAAVALGQPVKVIFEATIDKPVKPADERPEPLASRDFDFSVGDHDGEFLAFDDHAVFLTRTTGIENEVLGRIEKARLGTEELFRQRRLRDGLPRLSRLLVTPAWACSRYLPEFVVEEAPEGRAFLTLAHHRDCEVDPTGQGCSCDFLTILAHANREWTLQRDGTLVPLPEPRVMVSSILRYDAATASWDHGSPCPFDDVVRRRGPMIWDRFGRVFIPAAWMFQVLGDGSVVFDRSATSSTQ